MAMDSLKDLYVDELKDLYNAENQLVKALPKMAKKASAPELKRAFQNHLEQTKVHVERLEKIFKGLGEKPSGKTCKAMKGLVEEGKEIIDYPIAGNDDAIRAIRVMLQKLVDAIVSATGEARVREQVEMAGVSA